MKQKTYYITNEKYDYLVRLTDNKNEPLKKDEAIYTEREWMKKMKHNFSMGW